MTRHMGARAGELADPIYRDEDKARAHLERLRWPQGPVCPHCFATAHAKRMAGRATRPGLLKCRACRRQFSVTVGTVLERSKIPLTKWLAATYLIAATRRRVPVREIHRAVGVSYKSAWFMARRIREALRAQNAASGTTAPPLRTRVPGMMRLLQRR